MFTSFIEDTKSSIMALYSTIDTTGNQEEVEVVVTVPMKDTYPLNKAESIASKNSMFIQTRDDDVPSASSSMKGEERNNDSPPQESGSIYNWQAVLEQIRADTSLAKIAVDGVLPLHAACGDGAPIDVIKFLLKEYPEAAQAKCDKGYLPIMWHFELNTKSPSEEVVLALIEAYPGGAAAVNPENQLPIHLACKAKGVTEKIFTALLCANPEGAYVRDDNGKYPVNYAAANDDVATKMNAYNAFSTFLNDETFLNILNETCVSLTAAPLASMKAYASHATGLVLKCMQGIDNEEERRDFSDISNISEASKKSSKSAQDIAVPMARSRSGSSTTPRILNNSTNVEEPEKAEVVPTKEESSTSGQISKASRQSIRSAKSPVRGNSKLLFQLGCNVTKSADEKAATNEESAEVLPNPILKNSSTPKSKSTLCKMKGFLTSKLKKVS
jgi:ankyrin repeat protein